MDIEFHYYITYILVHEAGFSSREAAIIAHACQLTDDNNDKYEIALENNEVYRNYISQTLNIVRPKNRLVRIYTCFHFLPGEYESPDARRVDGSLHLFNTTPDSPAAQQVFQGALATGDLYRIGIATHAYADTWAHQNFVGFRHAFGDMEGMLERVMPSIGHADALHRPDIPNLCWLDKRLLKAKSQVDNKTRFLQAAKAVFVGFATHNKLANVAQSWERLEGQLRMAIGDMCCSATQACRDRKHRIDAYRAIAGQIPEYDSREWLASAVELVPWYKRAWERFWLVVFGARRDYRAKWMRIRRFVGRSGFRDTHWSKFQEAVKQHQSYVMGLDLLKDRYQQIDAAVQQVL